MASAQEGTETRTAIGKETGTDGHTKCDTMMILALGAHRMKERGKETERGTMTEAIEQTDTATVTIIVTGKGIETGNENESGIGIGIETGTEKETEIEIGQETGTETGKGPIAGAVELLPFEGETAEGKTNPAAPVENVTEITAGPALAPAPIPAAPTLTPAQLPEVDTAPVRSLHPLRPQWIPLAMITTPPRQKSRWRA